jgi:hypothetical protein
MPRAPSMDDICGTTLSDVSHPRFDEDRSMLEMNEKKKSFFFRFFKKLRKIKHIFFFKMSWKVDIVEFHQKLKNEAKRRNIKCLVLDNIANSKYTNIKNQSTRFPNEELHLKSPREIFDEIHITSGVCELTIESGQKGIWGSYFIYWKEH